MEKMNIKSRNKLKSCVRVLIGLAGGVSVCVLGGKPAQATVSGSIDSISYTNNTHNYPHQYLGIDVAFSVSSNSFAGDTFYAYSSLYSANTSTNPYTKTFIAGIGSGSQPIRLADGAIGGILSYQVGIGYNSTVVADGEIDAANQGQVSYAITDPVFIQ